LPPAVAQANDNRHKEGAVQVPTNRRRRMVGGPKGHDAVVIFVGAHGDRTRKGSLDSIEAIFALLRCMYDAE